MAHAREVARYVPQKRTSEKRLVQAVRLDPVRKPRAGRKEEQIAAIGVSSMRLETSK
jgi:hypothetical protein